MPHKTVLPRAEEAATKLLKFLKQDAVAVAAAPTSAIDLFSAVQTKEVFPIELDVTFIRAPEPHRAPLYMILPHEVHHGSICLITKPPQRKFKDIISKGKEDGHPIALRVSKVQDSVKLQEKFSDDPVKLRALANGFDNFVVHRVSKYPPLLTGKFLNYHAPAIFTPKNKRNLFDALTEAVRTAVCPRRGHSFVSVTIGHSGLSAAEIAENATAMVHQLLWRRDGCPPTDMLQIRLAAKNVQKKRAGLPIWSHDFDQSHPRALIPKSAAPLAAVEGAPVATEASTEAPTEASTEAPTEAATLAKGTTPAKSAPAKATTPSKAETPVAKVEATSAKKGKTPEPKVATTPATEAPQGTTPARPASTAAKDSTAKKTPQPSRVAMKQGADPSAEEPSAKKSRK